MDATRLSVDDQLGSGARVLVRNQVDGYDRVGGMNLVFVMTPILSGQDHVIAIVTVDGHLTAWVHTYAVSSRPRSESNRTAAAPRYEPLQSADQDKHHPAAPMASAHAPDMAVWHPPVSVAVARALALSPGGGRAFQPKLDGWCAIGFADAGLLHSRARSDR